MTKANKRHWWAVPCPSQAACPALPPALRPALPLAWPAACLAYLGWTCPSSAGAWKTSVPAEPKAAQDLKKLAIIAVIYVYLY